MRVVNELFRDQKLYPQTDRCTSLCAHMRLRHGFVPENFHASGVSLWSRRWKDSAWEADCSPEGNGIGFCQLCTCLLVLTLWPRHRGFLWEDRDFNYPEQLPKLLEIMYFFENLSKNHFFTLTWYSYRNSVLANAEGVVNVEQLQDSFY